MSSQSIACDSCAQGNADACTWTTQCGCSCPSCCMHCENKFPYMALTSEHAFKSKHMHSATYHTTPTCNLAFSLELHTMHYDCCLVCSSSPLRSLEMFLPFRHAFAKISPLKTENRENANNDPISLHCHHFTWLTPLQPGHRVLATTRGTRNVRFCENSTKL